ncbi:eukaryotic ribosomal protein P1 P2 family [Rhizoctonia solani]|uniref:Eukaryotic ribosomal protein P1 P2 family n=1 Tax=Rhizoctonia solani TaxID=456999 RepID=A0A8H7M0Q9_9AGAM|nr:eukaryotic ribosomal protein P1 P2 family [Rhizoctonia solani]
MSPQHQTKEVEYYRAAPTAPGMTLERVSPPRRSPSDPSAAIAPLSISKRVKSPPSNIIVPPKPQIARPPRSPARLSANLDSTQPPTPALPPYAALSRISLGSGPAEPTSPTDSLTVSSPSLRAEKLLRRLSRQSDGVRLPSDYGRVGISGYSVPNSAPVSPGLRGVPPPLREDSETPLALSVPMRREVPPPNNMLGLGLGLASDSFTSMSSLTSASSLSSNTISTLPSEATIKPSKEFETRTSRLGSLSSATTASTTSLITPVSPPTTNTLLTPMSPPKQLKLKGSLGLSLRIPSRSPSPSPIPDLLKDYRDSASYPLRLPIANRVSFRLLIASLVSCPYPPTWRFPLDPAPGLRLLPLSSRRDNGLAHALVFIQIWLHPVRDPAPRPSVHMTTGMLMSPLFRPSLESQTTPRPNIACAASPSAPTSPELNRPASPDIAYILRTTPRPTRKLSIGSVASSSTTGRRLPGLPHRPRSGGPCPRVRVRSRASRPDRVRRPECPMVTLRLPVRPGLMFKVLDPRFFGEQYDSEDSDSDLDLSTPLPHMMLRAGLLSPRSTIITEAIESAPVATVNGKLSARGEALRAKGEKVWKAEARRKVRHRDGQNLRDGVGLTTGLGWSDSEDEDAPSPLRRRLSSVLLAKTQSRPPSQLSRQSYTHMPLSRRSTYSNLESSSVSSASNPRTPAHPPMSLRAVELFAYAAPDAQFATGRSSRGRVWQARFSDASDRYQLARTAQPRSAKSTLEQHVAQSECESAQFGSERGQCVFAQVTHHLVDFVPECVPGTFAQVVRLGFARLDPVQVVGHLAAKHDARSSVQRSSSAAGTRLSAPEALRQSQSSLETTRRLSGS